MEPVFMVLGQSSATAAVMAIDAKSHVQKVDVATLQQRLKTNPLADGSIFEILVDNDDSQNVQRMGTWTTENKGGYGPGFFINQGGSKEIAAVRFTPNIPKKGKYDAYLYFPKVEKSSTRTQVTIFDGKSSHDRAILKSDIRVEGQTSGEWLSLGTFDLPGGRKSYVEVTTKDADGDVVADAVIWVPTK